MSPILTLLAIGIAIFLGFVWITFYMIGTLIGITLRIIRYWRRRTARPAQSAAS